MGFKIPAPMSVRVYHANLVRTSGTDANKLFQARIRRKIQSVINLTFRFDVITNTTITTAATVSRTKKNTKNH